MVDGILLAAVSELGGRLMETRAELSLCLGSGDL